MKRSGFGVGKPMLKGVTVSEKTGGVGAALLTPLTSVVAGAGAEPVRSENVGARVSVAKPKVAVVEGAKPEAKPEAKLKAVPEAAVPAAKPSLAAAIAAVTSAAIKPLVAPIEPKAEEPKPAAEEPKAVEPKETKETKAKSRFQSAAKPKVGVPEDAITVAEWRGDKPEAEFKTLLRGPNQVETRTPPAFTPISSPALPDFIVQVYSKYSPYLQEILAEATAAATADGTLETGGRKRHMEEIMERRKTDPPKELDRDACKRRNPENRELFHYQKFVRDYLSRGTPYRGLLLYHGLGSGKTCASIAAAEALHYGGQKTIFVLTPATLSNNYRKDIAKCGFYPLRQNNHWQFLKVTQGRGMKADNAYVWLTEILGLPEAIVERQGGGWVATPGKPSNWETLSADQRAAIKVQQAAHVEHRFKFIHYNGATPEALAALAEAGVKSGKQLFDNAVVVIDEVHNLVRTINGTQIGGQPISKIMTAIEPREATWSTPLARKTPGYRYPRAYTLYRLLQNAVNAKIIVLSATPMINYAQELAILLNIIGGEQRMAEIPLDAAADPAAVKEWIRKRTDVDFAEIEGGVSTVLNITPVPHGFSKVVRDDYSTRGFVRLPVVGEVQTSRERNMDAWAASIVAEMKTAGLLPAEKEVVPRILTMPLLPDDAVEFVDKFVDKNTLKVLNGNILKARAAGLVSYYRGGSEELMPRVGVDKVVKVPMSDYMFKEYSRARLEEIERDGSPVTAPESGKPFDLYAFATKSKQTGFLSQSRAACNWVFPEEVPRPKMDAKQQAKLLGVQKETTIAVDMVDNADVDPDMEHAEAAEDAVAVADEAVKPEPTALDATLAGILGSLMTGLESNADQFLNKALDVFSPKYAEMIANIRKSSGPALVYSQFKRLEGLGIFAAALRAAEERYLPLDIQKVGGQWEIPMELMDPRRPRYIMYTGDQDREKRRLLLQLYNADVAELPAKLATQCRELLGPDPAVTDNRDGRICRVFMITQSGAEGISLSNTRQVHIMEPYWNNVRLQQVIGRAIRLCSHMNLPWDDRVVDIFTYLSVFSPKQREEGSKQLMMADKSMSTDEMIFDIATKKQVLADELAGIMKSAAVDCQLHLHENRGDKGDKDAIQCFKYKEGARPMFMFHPDWRKDSVAAIRSAAAAP